MSQNDISSSSSGQHGAFGTAAIRDAITSTVTGSFDHAAQSFNKVKELSSGQFDRNFCRPIAGVVSQASQWMYKHEAEIDSVKNFAVSGGKYAWAGIGKTTSILKETTGPIGGGLLGALLTDAIKQSLDKKTYTDSDNPYFSNKITTAMAVSSTIALGLTMAIQSDKTYDRTLLRNKVKKFIPVATEILGVIGAMASGSLIGDEKTGSKIPVGGKAGLAVTAATTGLSYLGGKLYLASKETN